MKKNIILLALLPWLLVSCDKFLDIRPTGRVIPTTLSEYRELMISAYYTFPSATGKTAFRSDEFDMNNSSQDDLNSFKDIWTWNDFNPGDQTISFDWAAFYQSLYIANYTIESADVIKEGSPEEINQLVGEAYALRAYAHFTLVNLYGAPYDMNPQNSKGIPLKLNTIMGDVLSRNTVAEVYASVESDLNQAESLINVETWPKGLTYRFNKLGITAFKARLYLYMNDWQKAYDYSMKVLASKNTLQDLSNSTTYILPNNYQSVEAIVSLEQTLTATTQKAGYVADAFYGKYAANDLRRGKYFARPTASLTVVNKGGSKDFRCSFRVGEQYLNAAEAALHLPTHGRTEAQTILLSLMEKRFTTTGFNNKKAAIEAMTDDQFAVELAEERARELAFEGHRWFDLRRTTRPRLEHNFKGTLYVLEANDPRYTIPIPQEAIDANPGLDN